MPYVALEDVGTTRRRILSNRRRLQAWERTGGTCVVCDCRIDGVRDRWIVEHIRALELGGLDEIQNLGPAHEACGGEKTRGDHARAAKAKRQKLRHLGAGVIKRPMPGSRASALKRKVDGTVVPREERPRSRRSGGLKSESGEAEASGSTPIVVDAATNSIERLWPKVVLSAKEVESAAVDQMANRTSAEAKSANDTGGDDSVSGDVLPAIPIHLDFLFRDRPLMPGEDPKQYETLLRNIIQQIRPADVIEAIWVKDITDLIWEANRIRRWRMQTLIRAQVKAVENLIRPALPDPQPTGWSQSTEPSAETLAVGWMEGREEERAQVNEILGKRGLTAEDVAAHGFLSNLSFIERFDRMASLAEQRRDGLLREIERARAAFGQRARKAAADVLEIERSSGQ